MKKYNINCLSCGEIFESDKLNVLREWLYNCFKTDLINGKKDIEINGISEKEFFSEIEIGDNILTNIYKYKDNVTGKINNKEFKIVGEQGFVNINGKLEKEEQDIIYDLINIGWI